MTRQIKNKTLGLIFQALSNGFQRMKEFQDENRFGLEHTVLREQLNHWMQLVETLEFQHPYQPRDFQKISEFIAEQKKKNSWIGWL